MNRTEQLLVEVMDVIAQRFDKHAVLRGGMVLRVLGCERLTNDVDYVFVPYASKKDVVKDLLAALGTMPNVRLEHALHSTCLRVRITRDDVAVQAEIKTARQVPISMLSNRALARPYGWPARLIPVVDYPVALADKMAAWNERRLIRDVYDIWFYLRMGVRPCSKTLQRRLKKPNYSRLVKSADQFKGQSVTDFYAFLRQAVLAMTDKQVEAELADYLPPDELVGLVMRFRAAFATL
jgi:predicted nucleotidyltransferase component of viral defense system